MKCAPLKTCRPARGLSVGKLELATGSFTICSVKTWDPSRYHDTYRKRVLALIKKKQNGEKTVTPKVAKRDGKVLELMAALKHGLAREGQHGASTAGAKKQKGRAKRGPRRRKAA
jgi:DNA end-binding protein Ku